MVDALPDIDLKTEEIDQGDESDEGFVINENEHVHLNGKLHLPKPLQLSNNQQNVDQNQSRMPAARDERITVNDWLEETIAFSSMLARQTQATLGRIKIDFVQSGLKFDTDFRDHFIYIANNRLIESFDSFLLELPPELKTEDCSVNRYDVPKTYPRPIAPNRSASAVVKRHSPNSDNRQHPRFGIHSNGPRNSDILFLSRVSKENKNSASKEVLQEVHSIPRSEISMRQWNGNNRVENGKNTTNIYLNKKRSPPAPPLQRRRTVNDAMVMIPKVQMKHNVPSKSNVPNQDFNFCAAKPKQQLDQGENLAAKRVFERRQTVGGNMAKRIAPYNLRQYGADSISTIATGPRASRSISSIAAMRCHSTSDSNDLLLSGKSANAVQTLQAVRGGRNRLINQLPTRKVPCAVVPGYASRNMKSATSNMIKQDVVDLSKDEDSDDDSNGRRYCICREKSYGKMVACDNDNCPIEWFHFPCVGITQNPVGKWYCRKCRNTVSMNGSRLRE